MNEDLRTRHGEDEKTRQEIGQLRRNVSDAIVRYVDEAPGPAVLRSSIADAVREVFRSFIIGVRDELPQKLPFDSAKGADIIIDTRECVMYNEVNMSNGRRRYPTSDVGWLTDRDKIIEALENTLSTKRANRI